MPSQRYERVAAAEQDAVDPRTLTPTSATTLSHPSSPPPSFRSRASSRRSSLQTIRNEQEAEQSLADAFDVPSDDESDHEQDSRPLVNDPSNRSTAATAGALLQAPTVGGTGSSVRSSSSDGRAPDGVGTRDGVFANITAKPTGQEGAEEKPPTYEQSQQDPTPPYWETTILTPGGFNSDDVFVDGLLVGSLFSFVWNALISMSFQLIGFMLTYLLHTTHAAKHGSRAGLGITLIQYGFTMRNAPSLTQPDSPGADGRIPGVPSDPNDHDFDPTTMAGDEIRNPGGDGMTNMGISVWFSYVLIVVGWLLLIKGTSDFVRARRQEQLVRASPDRGLGVPVVATGEGPNAV